MIATFDPKFRKMISKRIEGYDLRVGILSEKPHMAAKRGKRGLKGSDVITTYAGGPSRKQSRNVSSLTTGQILVANMERTGINLLDKPFQDKSSEIMRFVNEFLKMAIAKKSSKRVENLMQAVVRNPMLRGDYGKNTKNTAKWKGFNRLFIDTAQMFKAIKAKVRRV